MLRTGYDLSLALDRPVQCVRRQIEMPLDVVDVRCYDPAAQGQMIDAGVDAERTRPFDWTAPPLIRFRVYRRAPDLFQLVVSHPLFDGWSLMTLLTELLADYRAGLRGSPMSDPPPPALSYADFVAAERAAIASPAARNFWREKVLAPATPSRSPTRTTRTRREVHIPDEVIRQLRGSSLGTRCHSKACSSPRTCV